MLSLSHSVIGLERARRRAAISVQQLRLLDLVEIDDLGDAGPARHQEQPRVIGVVDQQHARQRQVADRDGVGGELRVEGRRFAFMVRQPMAKPVAVIPGGQLHGPLRTAALAFSPRSPDIGPGRLAVDEPLANRVRSGRKQP